jgi:hypothetical protein
MAYEFRVLSLFPSGMVIGWQFYERNIEYNYHEFDLYLIFIHLQFRWANTDV